MFVKFDPPIAKFVVFQTLNLMTLWKKKKSKPKRL